MKLLLTSLLLVLSATPAPAAKINFELGKGRIFGGGVELASASCNKNIGGMKSLDGDRFRCMIDHIEDLFKSRGCHYLAKYSAATFVTLSQERTFRGAIRENAERYFLEKGQEWSQKKCDSGDWAQGRIDQLDSAWKKDLQEINEEKVFTDHNTCWIHLLDLIVDDETNEIQRARVLKRTIPCN